MRKKLLLLLAVAACLATLGCSRRPWTPLPTHDQVLIYDRPYDYTFLRVMQAVQNTPGWDIYETDQMMGLVRAISRDYDDPFNSDKRIGTFFVRRLGRRKTSVAFAPWSRQVIGGDALLKAIDSHMSRPPYDGYRALRTNTAPPQVAEREAAAHLEVAQPWQAPAAPSAAAAAGIPAGAPPEIQAAMQKAQAQSQPAPPAPST